jgi:MoaA/NifB/PqqE/SkfB family radical SAM enzyme
MWLGGGLAPAATVVLGTGSPAGTGVLLPVLLLIRSRQEGLAMTVGDRIFVLTARGAVTAGVRLLPLISEKVLVRFSRLKIAEVPWPEGQDFMERLLVFGKRALAESGEHCREKAATNFFYNYLVTGYVKRKAFRERYGFSPPYLLVVSPTMRCNLHCYGCYAGSYAKRDLDLDAVIRVLEEARAMGIYFIVISGGEPFVWRSIFDLFETADDMYFQVYTNGSLIDEEVAGRLADLGNVLPCISVEGFEKETDERRGDGAFRKIMRAMDLLRREGVIFGFSATATRENNDFIVSDEFVDFYETKGCFIGWYFNYVPVGRCPAMDLMPSPEQRITRRRRLLKLRHERRMLLADFWNDGPLTGGCIAGGRSYLHINSNGDIEPCVFTHFAIDNIANTSLRAALESDFFKAIRARVPYSDNYLRPCLIIDHPHLLRELVTRFGARPTHPGAELLLSDLKDDLDTYASEYGELADAEWSMEQGDRHHLKASGE